MQEALASEMVKQLQPAFYFIGSFVVLMFVSFGGGILKILHDNKKERKDNETKKQDKIDGSLEGLKNAVMENTRSIYKMEIKFDVFVDRHDKDINNLGRRLKEITN